MKDEDRIAVDIVSYLTQKPSAKDTFEGIAEWWLLKQQINQAVETVNRVLQALVAKEFVTVKKYQGQEHYYQINPSKMSEMEAYVEELRRKS